MAAGDFKLGEEIMSLSTDEWVEDGEYEDDFCYYSFFHRFIKGFEKSDRKLLESILKRFEVWLEGDLSTRFNICQSFYSHDREVFLEEFHKLIEEREHQIAKQRNTMLAGDITFEPRSDVFIEGLALLRIAKKMRFESQPEYKFCSAIAQLEPKEPTPLDIYIEIEKKMR